MCQVAEAIGVDNDGAHHKTFVNRSHVPSSEVSYMLGESLNLVYSWIVESISQSRVGT